MSSPRIASLLAVVLVAALLAGCGGEADVQTAASPGASAPAPTAATGTAAATTAGATGTAATAADAEFDPAVDLPDPEAVPGLNPGTPRRLGTAQEVIDVLYQSGDPTGPVARRRLERAGFAGGVLRDQAGADPATGPALLRTYALRLGSDDAAREEVQASVAEVQASTRFPSRDVALGIPHSRAIRIDLEQPNARVKVLFATFAVGPVLYGVQTFASGDARLPQDEVVREVVALRARVAGGG